MAAAVAKKTRARGSLTWERYFPIPPEIVLQLVSRFTFNFSNDSSLPLLFGVHTHVAPTAPSPPTHNATPKQSISLFLCASLSLKALCRELAMKGGRSRAETKKSDAKLSVSKRGAGKRPARKAKPAKDPNKPKRPPSAFFVFMEEFRKQYKEKHPNNKSVSVVGKAGGDKWKSMSDADKAPYIAKAEKRKTEYNKNILAYNKKMAEGPNAAEEEESDKSRSEVNDEDEEEEGSGEEEEEDE